MRCLLVLVLLLGQSSSDEALKREVEQALAAADFLDEASSVTVSARDGAVILTGEVKDAHEKLLAIEAAFTVPEVQEVETEFGFRDALTPDVEEEIWFRLMREGFDDGVQRILVDDGVARVELADVEGVKREQLAALVARVPGVRSVDLNQEAAGDAGDEVAQPEPEPEAELVTAPEPEPILEAKPAPETEPTARPGPSEKVDVGPPPRGADRVIQEIAQQIVSSPEYTVFDHIRFGMERGAVRLVGVVTDESKKRAIEARIASLPGAPRVINEIRVLRDASGDAGLRKRLFERIYSDSTFAGFADWPNPPVHIIVEASSVTLTGVVERPIDAMVAEALVRNTFGVRRIDNRLRVRSR